MRKISKQRTKGFLLRRILVALFGALFFIGLAVAGYSSAGTEENKPAAADIKFVPAFEPGNAVIQVTTGAGDMVLLHDGTQGSIKIDTNTELLIRPYLYKNGNILMEIQPRGFPDNKPIKRMVRSGKSIAIVGLIRNRDENPAIITLTPRLVREDKLFSEDRLSSVTR